MTSPIKFGTEFLINTTTLDDQGFPAITALADGRFVVTWTDYSQSGGDTSFGAVRAQVFNADGTRFATEFLVNTTTAQNQGGGPITTLTDGRFVVTFSDSSQSGGDASFGAVRAQMFNADGSKSGAEFLVNNQGLSGIASLDDSRFVVCWDDQGLSGYVIRAQEFNADGSKSGAEILVNTTRSGYPSDSDITALAGDRFVVTWRDRSESGGDTSGDALRAQVFNANGSKFGTEFLVNATTTNNQREPAITTLADGRFVVAWSDESASSDDTSFDAVRAQVFNPNGSKAGAEVLINTTTTGSRGDPDIATLADGRFVVAWTDRSVSTDDRYPGAIRAQVLNADGTKSGAEFLVNTTTYSYQFSPSITTLADGRIVVAWTDFSRVTDDISYDARGQIFDPRIAAVALTGTLANDEFDGTIFGDHMAGRVGDDRLFGAASDDRLYGGTGNDALRGGGGSDKVHGQAGNDMLYGGYGSDRLIGGTGEDIMNGGGNADVFMFVAAAQSAVGSSRDQIVDFKAGIDKLDFSAFMTGGKFIGGAEFTAGNGPQIRYTAAGIVSGDVGGDGITDFQLNLLGAPILTAGDILF